MKKEKIGNLIEKIFILLVILIYLALFFQKKYTNYISDGNLVGKYAGYFSIVILSIILITPIRRERKIGKWVIVFVITALCMGFSSVTDSKLSQRTQQNRPKNLGVKGAVNLKKGNEQKIELEYFMQNLDGKDITRVEFDNKNIDAEYSKKVHKDNVKEDPESHTWYINNRILISSEYKLSKEKLDEIGKKCNLKLVGQLPSIAQATYELPENLTLPNLIEKMTELQKEIPKIEKSVQVVDIVYPSLNITDAIQKLPETSESLEQKKETVLKRTLNENGEIVIDNKNFLRVLENVYTYPEIFEGKKIKMYGKTFKDKEMKENQIGFGMWQMVCCALDLSIVGYLTEPQVKMEDNTWYNIEGKITKKKQKLPRMDKEEYTPIIIIEKADKIKEPENSIIY